MKKLVFLLVALLVIQVGVSISLGRSNTGNQPLDKEVTQDWPGVIVVDVTDIAQGRAAEYLYSPDAQRQIVKRKNEMMATLSNNIRWPNRLGAPSVCYRLNGMIMQDPLPATPSRIETPFKTHQVNPPNGTITWEFTGSCNSGASPPDPRWDCATEMPNIQEFVAGGTPTVSIGMDSCIRDVFGRPFFSNNVFFRRNDVLPAGTFAQYTFSGVGSTGYIDMPTDCGRATNYYSAPFSMTSGEARLEALTHEMVHAFYDDLNFYYHPWVEGMTECQSVLARKLFIERNPAYWNLIVGYYTANPPNMPKLDLTWGAPPSLPLYENCNQDAIAAGGGWFYTGVPGQRMLNLAPTRYQMAASAWWKVWRETIPANTVPGLISSTNNTTYGAGTFFVDFNSRYFDRYLITPPAFPGLRGDPSTLNTLVADTLLADADSLSANVENQDYITIWHGNQHILKTGTTTGGKLYLPHGPMTPQGGLWLLGADQRPLICDMGSHFMGYWGAGFSWGIDFSPVFYQTTAGGFEAALSGTASCVVYRLANGADVTANVLYHLPYNSGAPPAAWSNVPLSPNPVFTFAGDGRLTEMGSPTNANRPAGFYFVNAGAGGYQMDFMATTGGANPITANQTGYFAAGEQTGNGVHSGVIIGGGGNGGDRFAFSYNGNPFSPLTPFGGDSSFADPAFSDGVKIGYQYLGAGAPYPDLDYANTGVFYYIKKVVTSFNRLNVTLPPYTGRYGFAMIAQSTDFGDHQNPPNSGNGSNIVYYEQFINDSNPAAVGITNLRVRPDYIPDNSRLVAAFIYANSVGRDMGGGNFQHVPILINAGRTGNPDPTDPNYFCTGTFLGRNNDATYRPSCGCWGWGGQQSTFRFDITRYIDDIYDYVTITNMWQNYEPASAWYYGFELVYIYENDYLPLSQIQIADGALTMCNNDRPNSATTFTGFRTPPNPSSWPVDGAGASAYVGILGNSADNGSCGNGTFNTEWDFWACGTDLVPMDNFWLNPQPADPNINQGGAWWAPGWMGANDQWSNPPTRPPGFPNPYYYSPRAMDRQYYSTAKQYSCAWFWNRNFTVVAAKTALHWAAGTWWDTVQRDYDTAQVHRPSRTYFAGMDSSVILRPYLVCDLPTGGDPVPTDINIDGRGPCVSTEYGNGCPPGLASPPWRAVAGSCQPISGPAPAPFYPRSDERGDMHAFILQIPVVPTLKISKECTPNPVLPNGIVSYVITVTNDTPYWQNDVTVQETYPNGVSFYDSNPPADSGDNIWNDSIGISPDLSQPDGHQGRLAPYETFVIIVRVKAGKLAKGTKLNNVVLTYAATAPNPEYAQCEVEVLGEPIISITKTTRKFMALQGEKISYKLVIRNIGTREAMNVIVSDLLPRELEYVESVPSGSVGLQKILWSLGMLNPGETRTIDLVLRIRRDIQLNPGMTIINTALATSDEGLVDKDTALIVLRGGATEPVVCDCPDFEIRFGENAKVVTVKVSHYSGCGPYDIELFVGDKKAYGKPVLLDPGQEKEFTLDVEVQKDDILTIISTDKYGHSCRSERKKK